MSLILEALKKIETDKSRNVQKANIASAILQPDSGAKRRNVLLISCLIFSAAVLLVAAGAGISYLLTAKGQDRKASEPVQHNMSAQTAVTTPSIAGPEIPATAREASQKPSATAQSDLPLGTAAATPPSIAQSEKSAEPSPRLFKSAPSEASRPLQKKPSANRAMTGPEKIQPVEPPSAPKRIRNAPIKDYVPEGPPIRVSGIIWSEESDTRRALVNGSSVKEGDTVDGVLVERIEPNHIRCSKNGNLFKVSIK